MELLSAQDLRAPSKQLSKTSNLIKTLVIRYDTITYRNHEINFLSTVDGKHCYAQIKDQLVDLGLNNLYYKEDACRFIDRELDLITTFSESPALEGAKLEYFHNGNFRDIKLSYKGRILKIFLVAGQVNETFLISESKKLLFNSGLLESRS